jgi:hypothetical protein
MKFTPSLPLLSFLFARVAETSFYMAHGKQGWPHQVGANSLSFVGCLSSLLKLFFFFFDFVAPGAWNTFLSTALSFVWAFIPLQFGLVLAPAVAEMKAAFVIAKQELLCDQPQAEAKPVSAESSLRRALPHVAAAATTAGRCSEVFGIVVLVRI